MTARTLAVTRVFEDMVSIFACLLNLPVSVITYKTDLRLRVALTEMFNNFARGLTETSARVIYDPTPTRHGGEGDGDSTDEPLEQLPSPPLSSSSSFLPRKGVEAWLLKINRTLGRGSEFRAAEVLMGPGPGGGLTLEGDWLT